MHSNVIIKNVIWPHFSWPTLYSVHTQNAINYKRYTDLKGTLTLKNIPFKMNIYVK